MTPENGPEPAPAPSTLDILIVEDVAWDAELMRIELARNGTPCVTRRVEREDAFREALDERPPDIILADYTLPRFSALRVVRIVAELGLDIPTILVSGTITEEVARACLRAGISDYILKNSLLRLGPAVAAALEARRIRSEGAEARRQVEALSKIVEESLHEIYIFSADTLRFLHANQAALANIGYSLEKLSTLTPIDLEPEFSRVGFEAVLSPLRSGTRDAVVFESVHRREDGTEYAVEAHVQCLDYMGEPAFAAFVLDLDSREKAADQQRALETRFSSFANSSSDAMIVSDERGVIRYWNRAAESIFGYRRDEALGMPLVTIIPEPHRARHLRGMEDALSEGGIMRTTSTRVHGLRRDGVEVPIELTLGSWIQRDGAFFSAVARDITEQEKAERKVRGAAQHLRALLNHLPIVTYEANASEIAIIEWMSPQVDALLGTPSDVWLEGPEVFLGRVHPEDRDRVMAAAERGREVGAIDVEYRIAHEDGHYVRIRDRAVLGPASTGDARQVLRGVWVDVTAASEAERERQLLSAAVEQSSDLVLITDPDGCIEYTNPAFEEITGYTEEEVLGQNPRILKGGRLGVGFYEEMWKELRAGRPWYGDFPNRRKDGTEYVQRSTIFPVLDDEGRVQNLVGVGKDVSSELSVERQLRQAQKMEAVGRLTGGIAHDFNNVLGAILTNAQLLSMTLPGEFTGEDSEVADIAAAARRGADLIRRLMAFSRDEYLQLEVVDPSVILNEAQRLLSSLLPENIDLVIEEDHRGAVAALDQGATLQILMNLATNARDAMPDGGTLSLSTAVVADGSGRLEIEVRDTGTGMDEATVERVFEPFFTTKSAERGTGLGLAMVHTLVKRHGGTIDVSSRPDVGTAFRIRLPLAEAPEQTQEDEIEPRLSDARHRGKTVLLVEDEEPLRNAGRRVLEYAGFRVLVAEHGADALRLLEEHEGEISLVVTDLIMPVMGGGELYEATRGLVPRPAFVVTTGYGPDEVARCVVSDGLPILRKPWDAAALVTAAHEALDGAPRESRPTAPAVSS
jgi:PAS domain S-box-containing protein